MWQHLRPVHQPSGAKLEHEGIEVIERMRAGAVVAVCDQHGQTAWTGLRDLDLA